MNIAQTYRMLTSILPDLSIKYSKYDDAKFSFDYMFNDLAKFKNAYDTVEKFAPFLIDEYSKEVFKSVFYKLSIGISSHSTDKREGSDIVFYSKNLHSYVQNFLNFIAPTVQNESVENAITVKFTHIKTLSEFEKTIGQLKNALLSPVFELDGRSEIISVENGSILIDILITAPVALKIIKAIGDIIKTAVETRKIYLEGNVALEHAKKMGMETEILELYKKRIEENTKTLKAEKAEEIIARYIPEKNSPSNIISFEGSIDMFSKLLEKGAEFYPSVNAPEEIQNAFPNPEEQRLIEAKIKYLNEGKNENSESDEPEV